MLVCVLLLEDVLGNRGVPTREVTQLEDPVGVGDEAHVQDVVGVQGQAVLETEALLILKQLNQETLPM